MTTAVAIYSLSFHMGSPVQEMHEHTQSDGGLPVPRGPDPRQSPPQTDGQSPEPSPGGSRKWARPASHLSGPFLRQAQVGGEKFPLDLTITQSHCLHITLASPGAKRHMADPHPLSSPAARDHNDHLKGSRRPLKRRVNPQTTNIAHRQD